MSGDVGGFVSSHLNVSGLASAWGTLALVVLLLVRHVLQPRLSEPQRRSFQIAILPLLSLLAIHIIADFLEALP